MSAADNPAVTPAAEAGLGYASGPGRWVLLATVLGSAMASIDATVVGIALPAIGRDFGASMATLQWVVTAYTLTLAGLLLFAGALGDRYGRRSIFLTGVVWFALASLLCGLAPSAAVLIVARAVQGSDTPPPEVSAVLTTSPPRLKRTPLPEAARASVISAVTSLRAILLDGTSNRTVANAT